MSDDWYYPTEAERAYFNESISGSSGLVSDDVIQLPTLDTMRVVSADRYDAVVAERDRLREALEAMPVVTLQFDSREKRDAWNAWRRSTFNPDGSVRTALQEAE